MKGFAGWQILFLFAKPVGQVKLPHLNNHISSWLQHCWEMGCLYI
ncbi:hypothetical protein [Peribacillus frigoritolerans]|uniref:Uncharacterized protein n=1 Tax=Peribacillus castrilensis TaxID=2897690 RepID=A0AAW9N9B9_9BACI|nr:hypothetical protein [Peribacillus castrilensis]MEC0296894.1 hypothetical protein [Peribacillus castrilensis]MEC0346770.1 hypothetical protein [Peribacillus castrilensis]